MISPMSNRSRFSPGQRETTLGRKHGRKWGDKEPQLTLGSPSPSLGKTCGCLMWQSYIPDAHVLEYIHEHFYCWEASYGKSKCPASFALWMPGLSCSPCEERDPEGSLHFCWGQKDLKAGTQRENIQLVLSLLLKWVLGTGGERRQRSQENYFIYPWKR